MNSPVQIPIPGQIVRATNTASVEPVGKNNPFLLAFSILSIIGVILLVLFIIDALFMNSKLTAEVLVR